MPSVSRQRKPIKNAHSVLYLEVQNYIYIYMDLSGGSDGKESACIVEEPGLIPGSERAPRK